jgi:hypothetical protein
MMTACLRFEKRLTIFRIWTNLAHLIPDRGRGDGFRLGGAFCPSPMALAGESVFQHHAARLRTENPDATIPLVCGFVA